MATQTLATADQGEVITVGTVGFGGQTVPHNPATDGASPVQLYTGITPVEVYPPPATPGTPQGPPNPGTGTPAPLPPLNADTPCQGCGGNPVAGVPGQVTPSGGTIAVETTAQVPGQPCEICLKIRTFLKDYWWLVALVGLILLLTRRG